MKSDVIYLTLGPNVAFSATVLWGVCGVRGPVKQMSWKREQRSAYNMFVIQELCEVWVEIMKKMGEGGGKTTQRRLRTALHGSALLQP